MEGKKEIAERGASGASAGKGKSIGSEQGQLKFASWKGKIISDRLSEKEGLAVLR